METSRISENVTLLKWARAASEKFLSLFAG